MPKALDEYTKEKDIRPPRVVSPKRFLEELRAGAWPKSEESVTETLSIQQCHLIRSGFSLELG